MASFPELGLTVILPAYNEEDSIDATIPRAIESLRRVVGRFEVILINDASTDRTPERAEAFAREYPELRVIHNERNLRQGGCLAKGFALAKYELVTHNAMDYPFDFDDLPDLLRFFPQADIVVASRKTYPGISRPRKLVSDVNRLLLRGLFGAHVKDYNFIQIYKRSVLEKFPAFSTAPSFITAETIIRAHRAGLSVVELAIDYHPRLEGVPKSATFKNIKQALVDMGRLWTELRREDIARVLGKSR